MLKRFREGLIDNRIVQKSKKGQKPEPLSRNYVNQSIDRVRAIFNWGVSECLVKPETHYALILQTGTNWRFFLSKKIQFAPVYSIAQWQV